MIFPRSSTLSLSLAALCACQADPPAPIDPIVGGWTAPGSDADFHATFDVDGQVEALIFVHTFPGEVQYQGTWSREPGDGFYRVRLHCESVTLKGSSCETFSQDPKYVCDLKGPALTCRHEFCETCPQVLFQRR